MKKMMISTALATSLIAGVASADTSISAYIETTLGSGETPATSNPDQQGTSIGYEHGVGFSGSKDLDNGMTLKTYFGIEDGGAADKRGITFVTGNTEILIEADVNNIDDKQTVPTIINKIEDGNKGLGVSYNANKHTIHNDNGIGVRQKFDMGTVSFKYVPKVAAGSGFNDSNPGAVASGSGMAYGFNGSFGVDGLSVLASFNQVDQSGLEGRGHVPPAIRDRSIAPLSLVLASLRDVGRAPRAVYSKHGALRHAPGPRGVTVPTGTRLRLPTVMRTRALSLVHCSEGGTWAS